MPSGSPRPIRLRALSCSFSLSHFLSPSPSPSPPLSPPLPLPLPLPPSPHPPPPFSLSFTQTIYLSISLFLSLLSRPAPPPSCPPPPSQSKPLCLSPSTSLPLTVSKHSFHCLSSLPAHKELASFFSFPLPFPLTACSSLHPATLISSSYFVDSCSLKKPAATQQDAADIPAAPRPSCSARPRCTRAYGSSAATEVHRRASPSRDPAQRMRVSVFLFWHVCVCVYVCV